MASQEYVRLTISGNGKFNSSFNLPFSQIAKFRDRLLEAQPASREYERMKGLQGCIDNNHFEEVRDSLRRGRMNFQKLKLLVAIDYCEERRQGEVEARGLLVSEENRLGLDAERIRTKISDCQKKLKELDERKSELAGRLGEEYAKSIREIMKKRKEIMDSLGSLRDPSPFCYLTLSKGSDLPWSGTITESEKGVVILLPFGFGLTFEGEVADNIKKSFGSSGTVSKEGVLKALLDEFSLCATSDIAKLCAYLKHSIPRKTAGEFLYKNNADPSWLRDFDETKAAQADLKLLKGCRDELKKTEAKLSEIKEFHWREVQKICKTLSTADVMKNSPIEWHVREIIRADEEAIELADRMVSIMKRYGQDAIEYCETCRRLIEVKESLEEAEKNRGILSAYDELLEKIKAKNSRIEDISHFQRKLEEELLKITEKEKKKRLHRLNSPKEKPEKKPKFVYVPKASAQQDLEAIKQARIKEATDAIVKKALDYFPVFKNSGKYSNQHDNFEKTIRELCAIYVRNGCKLAQQHLIGAPEFGNKRASPKKHWHGSNGEFKLVRVALSSKKNYCLLLNVVQPECPTILYAGYKDDYIRFLNKNHYLTENAKAAKDGRRKLFCLLSQAAKEG
ncbi:MAG: hypothetical protein N3E51_04665 [Candidatus Micrarchaeota archaeon]|nr:hypothetical protein [Candidatus Micrarchaeota archaeon]